ncbi:methylated-DNA-[protein]-cysteine S-methyltransferase [Chitinophaga jiangningensis]|uniref:Methylated-DNA--protein-cysteine methyltransferase n=1 Tax=Chitinophaga jiangningensis TaxID=1419482 RepID=A0A1M7LNV1_9BACT|nr:methylated-DNA--[protein]-cysteine S-methyltransferase [Chitinophaga jiangningensis]SHM79874.1 methylated-DNA-[protein]-cysteine S-methyltransferase [Chitinophaga jiangningensis]
MYYHRKINTPVGELQLIATDKGLRAILWEDEDGSRVKLPVNGAQSAHPVLDETTRQLEEYFAGRRRVFDLPLHFEGTTFQRQVWEALLRIPYGQTVSYAQLANLLGNPKAVRAVGAANGKNPISIVAPCHRVIGSSGSLTGFAGGIAVKERLLKMEGAITTSTLF